jgi:hypothetical protein
MHRGMNDNVPDKKHEEPKQKINKKKLIISEMMMMFALF